MPQAEIDLIECPRDAMQGIDQFIPTPQKIEYLNALLRVGFHTLDFGSFVSPKAIPQMRDTAEVLENLDTENTNTRLLSIVANVRGGKDAVSHEAIDYLGYPFSVSEVFQKRNTNKTIAESKKIVDELLEICDKADKELVVYLSMGFGNPYDEPWSAELVGEHCQNLAEKGIKTLSLSDTIGTSDPEMITDLFETLIPRFPETKIGAHLHTAPHTWHEKVEAAYNAGCRRFDSAIKGFGGCPMATDDLVGNMPTEKMLSFIQSKKLNTDLNSLAFETAYNKALEVFPS